MGKHLNPLEKEVLIRRYQANPNVNIDDFCMVNNISVTAFKNWQKKYSEQGIEGLISKASGSEITELLPDGIDPTVENIKRELIKVRIENERLKKNYTVMKKETGELVFKALRKKSLK